MKPKSTAPVLAELVQFIWAKPERAFWAPWEGSEGDNLEAFVPANAKNSDPYGWDFLLEHAGENEYARDPWLIAPESFPYEPLREEPALFREFASLPFERDAYVGFAQSYGSLTGRHEFALPDRLSDWAIEHYMMRLAVALFDALRERATDDLGALGIRIENADARGANDVPIRGLQLVSLPYTPDEGLSRLFPDVLPDDWMRLGDRPAAWSSIRSEFEFLTEPIVVVDARPRAVVQAVLAHVITDALARNRVTPTLTPDGGPFGTGLRLSFKVSNLAGAMWLQLSLAVDGDRKYGKCPECGKWWDATDARSHKKVCSDKCRARKSYRERQERAAEVKEGETNG